MFFGNLAAQPAFKLAMMRMVWKYLWPLPWTAAGLVAALTMATLGARWRFVHGVLEVQGGLLTRGCRRLPVPMRFDAITIGHVILAMDGTCLEAVRAHEHVHVRQYERWGALFVPAYLPSSAWQWWRGGHAYLDNRFEREAYALAPCHAVALASQPRADNGTGLVE